MHIDFVEIDRWQTEGSDAHAEAPGSLLNVIDGLTEPHQSHISSAIYSIRPLITCTRWPC